MVIENDTAWLALLVSVIVYEPAAKPDGNCATVEVFENETTVTAVSSNTTAGACPVGLKPPPVIVNWLLPVLSTEL
jgi:hypothetical protein